MTQMNILEELQKLTTAERLSIVEATLRMLREELQHEKQSLPQAESKRHLTAAATALLEDYAAGGELTVFTDLR
jgi:hypothetical protein